MLVVFAAEARYALALLTAHAGDQVFAERATGRGADAVVDGLVRDGVLGIIRPHAFEYARDLRSDRKCCAPSQRARCPPSAWNRA